MLNKEQKTNNQTNKIKLKQKTKTNKQTKQNKTNKKPIKHSESARN